MKWSCSQAAIRKLRPTWKHVGRRHCVWTARSATQTHCTWPCSSEFANGLTISIYCTSISITIRSRCFPVSPHHLLPRSMADLHLPEHQVVFATFPSIPVISISDTQRRPVPNAGWIRTSHHGLPERLLTPQSVRPAYFAFLGRISPEKAVDRAIWIAKHCGVPLKIAAKVDTVDRDYFESEIRKLLTPPDVEYIGEISDSEKSSFLSGAMALLAPIAWPEPFGLVLIEAMACGTPVIAFNRGSVPEIVEDGLTGFVVEGMEEAVAATDRLSRLSRRAIRQRFEERFTSRRMAREYLIVYRSLIGKRPQRQLPRRRTQDARKSGAEYRGQLY
jgi:glycosyltransferase involved in cell wall biosynthesis